MAKSKEETVNDVVSKFSSPPKVAKEEELAVKQALQKLAHKLSEDRNAQSLLQEVPIEMIKNIARHGQLTLVAESLDDSFLRSIESLVKTSQVVFEAKNSNSGIYQMTKISDLYEQCRLDLEKNMGKNPAFHDVLLRMYSIEGPFFKKMNAIVGGYDQNKNISMKTSEDEIRLSFLLHVAVHRAGLDKRSIEFQTTPDEVFRGQTFGLNNFIEKADRLNSLYKEGKLATLTLSELSEINIVDIVAKKNLSTTSEISKTELFSWGEGSVAGVVLHLKNPEAIADFYNIANISAVPDEAEFMSRIPDDVVMLPVNYYQEYEGGPTHIDVICIRSESILLHNSTLYTDTRDSLKQLIRETSEKIVTNSFGGMFLTNIKKEQIALLSTLESIINLSETQLSSSDPAQQEQFLEMGYVLLNKLYQTKPSEDQLKQFNTINNKFQEFSAVFANLNVVHGVHNPSENIKIEQKKISTFLTGMQHWFADLNKKGKSNLLDPVKNDLDTLINLNSKDAATRESADNISKIKQTAESLLNKLTSNDRLGENLPGLKERMIDIIKSIDHIECCQKSMPASNIIAVNTPEPNQNISNTKNFKQNILTLKTDDLNKAPVTEEANAPQTPTI